MIEIALIKTLMDVAHSVINLSKHFSNKEQKEAIAEWLINVGNIVNEVADKLSNLEYPGGACGKMEVYINKFQSIAGDVLSVEDVSNLMDLLKQVRQIEKIFGKFVHMTQQEQSNNISLLREISGKLIAHGEILRLGR